DKGLLEKQKHYFVDLREQVAKGIEADKSVDDVIKAIDMPWYKEWTGVTPTEPNIIHVYSELTGRIAPWDLAEDFGIYEGAAPSKDTPGRKPPKGIVVGNLMPARLAELKRVAPTIEFTPAKDAVEAAKVCEDADAVIGFTSPDILKNGKNLRWIQVNHAGVE